MLERQCERLFHASSHEVKISILAVDRLRYQLPAWGVFSKAIRCAITKFPEFDLDAEKVLATLTEKIKNASIPGPAGGNVENFRKVILGRTASSTQIGMHCEAVLASLLANGSEGVGTSAVDDISQVIRFSFS